MQVDWQTNSLSRADIALGAMKRDGALHKSFCRAFVASESVERHSDAGILVLSLYAVVLILKEVKTSSEAASKVVSWHRDRTKAYCSTSKTKLALQRKYDKGGTCLPLLLIRTFVP